MTIDVKEAVALWVDWFTLRCELGMTDPKIGYAPEVEFMNRMMAICQRIERGCVYDVDSAAGGKVTYVPQISQT